MADRTTNKVYDSQPSGRKAIPIKTTVALPIGALVGVDSTGFAIGWDAAADTKFAGIAVGGENENSSGIPLGDTTQTPDPAIYVDTGGAVLTGVAVANSTQATLFDRVYTSDTTTTDNPDDFDVTAVGTEAPVGILVGWRSATDCDVQLFTPAQHSIGVSAAGTGW